MLTSRLEKYKGVTLIVGITDGWMSIVWDATGHIFEGPVTNDEDVNKIAALVIPILKEIGAKS